ncbi:MAG: AraC family ligand binding domain-containing protein, partial [Clostridia bacterium]|nr:AraC family ligand binding domain-containing protein [Clostridia bacterium]
MVTRLTSDQYNDPITGSMPNIIPSVQFAAPIHCHDYYEFFLITKGSVLHIVNNDIQRLTEGALVFVRPDDIHCYDYDGNSDCEFLNIPFAAPMIEEAFAYLGEAFDSRRLIKAKMPPFTFILSWAKERLLNLVSRIQMASMNDKTHARVILKGLLIEIFTQYFSESSPGADSSIPVWLENLMIEMHKKEKFIEGITAMYDLASCTPGHLNKVFKKYF